MAIYTICPNFIEYGCSKNKIFLNILMIFCQENGKKVALDTNDVLQVSYQSIMKKDEKFRMWIKFLLTKKRNYTLIDIELKEYGTVQNLAIILCSKTYDRKLICVFKEHYSEFKNEINKKEIELLDKDELQEEFKNVRETTIRNTIKTNGDYIEKKIGMEIHNQNIFGGNQQFADKIINESSNELKEDDREVLKLFYDDIDNEEKRQELVEALNSIKSEKSSPSVKANAKSILSDFFKAGISESGKIAAREMIENGYQYLEPFL